MKLDNEKNEYILEDADILEVEALKGIPLTPEAIEAIKTVAANYNKKNVGLNGGLIKQRHEHDIFKLTQIPKQEGERDFEYTNRAFQEWTNKVKAEATGTEAVSGLQKQLEQSKTEIADLRQKLEKGDNVDPILKKELADLKQHQKDLQNQLEEAKKSALEAKKAEQKALSSANEKMLQFHANSELNAVTAGKKMAPWLNEKQINGSLRDAKAELFAEADIEQAKDAQGNPRFNNDGSPVLWLRSKQSGNIMTSQKKAGEPYTLQERFSEILEPYAIFDNGRQASGAGTAATGAGGGAGGGKPTNVEFMTAPTKMALSNLITQHLKEQGIDTTTPGYNAKVQELWKQYVRPDMPLQ